MAAATPRIEITDDTSIEPVRHTGDVRFIGTIRAGRSVQVGGALVVDGDVKAVQLSVSGPLTVSGGLNGEFTGRYTVGGLLTCGTLRAAKVMARGDILARVKILDCHITCAGQIGVPDGVIVGGDIAANGGIECRALGDAELTKTIVEAGAGRSLRLLSVSIAQQIEERRQRSEIMRASIEPMMQQIKSLSPAQREKATEMLYQADELDDETTRLSAVFEARERRTREQSRPRVAVAEGIHPGVIVRLAESEVTVTDYLPGPLTLSIRTTDDQPEIIATRPDTEAVTVLPTRPRTIERE